MLRTAALGEIGDRCGVVEFFSATQYELAAPRVMRGVARVPRRMALDSEAACSSLGSFQDAPQDESQDAFMVSDECIAVNYMDEVVGSDSKGNCHKFEAAQPRGILHRAFSVMLFDERGLLLLQQRSEGKITFPGVWSNTCCSHPLHGRSPDEVDSPADIASGSPIGVKRAAVRKLEQELGIPGEDLDIDRFRFLTRVHYWAADTQTYGVGAPWGEHEIDYLLLYQLRPGEALTLRPNPEEVDALRWISRADLRKVLSDSDAQLAREMPRWSPWFRIIFQRFLDTWWGDLEAAIATDRYVDTSTIHRFDSPAEFHGGAGMAGPHLDSLATAEKAARTVADRRQLVLQAELDAKCSSRNRSQRAGMRQSARKQPSSRLRSRLIVAAFGCLLGGILAGTSLRTSKGLGSRHDARVLQGPPRAIAANHGKLCRGGLTAWQKHATVVTPRRPDLFMPVVALGPHHL